MRHVLVEVDLADDLDSVHGYAAAADPRLATWPVVHDKAEATARITGRERVREAHGGAGRPRIRAGDHDLRELRRGRGGEREVVYGGGEPPRESREQRLSHQ